MNIYGLIGFPLTHSYSKKYFTEKFVKEHIADCCYELFELKSVQELPELLKSHKTLRGLNVTIPYKQDVIPLLDDLDEASAKRVGAVNTIKVYADGSTKGFNTDYYGFKQSLLEWFDRKAVSFKEIKALVLGNGGAAKAVKAALDDLSIPYEVVSRTPADGQLSYEQITDDVIGEYLLIINTTPLGMYPETNTCPPIPYDLLGHDHLLYDLVYNPEETLFLKNGAAKGAATHNGLKMLYLQAEKAWSIWNYEDERVM